MTIGSLFSGIGGLELGLEWAGLGPVLWQVESNEWCRGILERHWPEAVRYDDVKTIGSSPGHEQLVPVDIICGGFPCQDVSGAGKGAGLAGSRSGLWFEFARIVGELQPEWVVVENVASGARRWVDTVRRGLGELGYETLPIPLRASDVGAPHRRSRVFIVGHADSDGLPSVGKPRSRRLEGRAPGSDLDRSSGKRPADRGQGNMADSLGSSVRDERQWLPRGRQDGVRPQGDTEPEHAGATGGHGAQPGVGASVDGLPRRLDRWPAGPGQPQHAWEPARAINRPLTAWEKEQLRAIGNAVMPQCAEVVGWMVRELAGGES